MEIEGIQIFVKQHSVAFVAGSSFPSYFLDQTSG